MSWLFSFLLVCYALVRIAMRVRGQLRYLRVRETLPTPPPTLISAPAHLPRALAAVYLDTRGLRIALVDARRTLMMVALTDPDAALGRVRDARYRRALMENWTRIGAWLGTVRELDEVSAAVLADRHLDLGAVAQLRTTLTAPWRAVARARALDLFELDDLRAVERTFEQLDEVLAEIEDGLGRVGDDPYRDRFVNVAVAT